LNSKELTYNLKSIILPDYLPWWNNIPTNRRILKPSRSQATSKIIYVYRTRSHPASCSSLFCPPHRISWCCKTVSLCRAARRASSQKTQQNLAVEMPGTKFTQQAY